MPSEGNASPSGRRRRRSIPIRRASVCGVVVAAAMLTASGAGRADPSKSAGVAGDADPARRRGLLEAPRAPRRRRRDRIRLDGLPGTADRTPLRGQVRRGRRRESRLRERRERASAVPHRRDVREVALVREQWKALALPHRGRVAGSRRRGRQGRLQGRESRGGPRLAPQEQGAHGRAPARPKPRRAARARRLPPHPGAAGGPTRRRDSATTTAGRGDRPVRTRGKGLRTPMA